MPINNPMGDHFNPPSNMSQDFEEYYFEDLEVDELFWQTNKPKEGQNLKTRTTHSFQRKTKVFQKI